MKKDIIKIKGMHCTSCSQIIEKTLKKSAGIISVNVSYANEKAIVEYNDNISYDNIVSTIKELGYGVVEEKKKVLKIDSEIDSQKNKVLFIIPVMSLSIILMIWELIEQYRYFIPNQFIGNLLSDTISKIPVLPMPMSLLMLLNFFIASIFMFWVGRDYLFAIFKFFSKGVATMDTLVGIGTFTAYLYSSVILLFPQVITLLNLSKIYYFDSTIIVISFIYIGKYLEAKAKKRTNEAIEMLIGLQTKTALIEKDGKEREIDISDLQIGDIIIVKPGSKIPTDAKIIFGATSIDESLITGESVPVDKSVGDRVIGGTINKQGFIKAVAEKIGNDTLLAHIIKTVEDAQSSKAPIQKIADKISAIFVPVVIVIALLTALFWIGFGYFNNDINNFIPTAITTFVAILVIACPCALGLATPLGIIVGVGLASKKGILIKNAESLEKLHSVDVIAFDKTGTITKGVPELNDVVSINSNRDEFLSILKSLESKSEHPIAKAIVDSKENVTIKNVDDFSILEGYGIRGDIENVRYFAGNLALLRKEANQFTSSIENEINSFASEGKTPIILFTKEKVLGFVTVADSIKDNSIETIKNLHKIGIKTVMITGDHRNVATYIGNKVGIERIISEVLPENKAEKIKELQKEFGKIAMVGDGINDAPALALADLSIAMSTGSDIAIESSDITILHGDLEKILKAIKISKLTIRKIKQNLFLAFIYNIVLIPIAAGILYIGLGLLLSPVFAGLAMALSSISVVSNTLLMKYKSGE